MLKLASKLIKKRQNKFCEIRKINNLIDDIQNDPLKKYLFDKEEIKKRVIKIDNLFKSSEERQNNLHENLIKKNNSQSLFSLYKKREIKNIEGLKNEKIQILKEKYDYKKFQDLNNNQWDYELNVSEKISVLNKKSNYLVNDEKSHFLENDLKNNLDFVKVSHDFSNLLNCTNFVEDLKNNEILVSNLNFYLRISDLKKMLKNYGNFDFMEIKRNLLNSPALVKLNFKNLEEKNNFVNNYENDLNEINFHLLTEENLEEENIYNRRIVIENIDKNISEEELLLKISKYGNILNYYFPKDLKIGKIPKTSEIKKYLIDNKKKIPDEIKIELEEFDGEELKKEIIYETKKKMKFYDNFSLANNKNSLDLETLHNLKLIEHNEYIKKIERDMKKLKLISIKDNKTYMDYIMESNYITNQNIESKNNSENLIEENNLENKSENLIEEKNSDLKNDNDLRNVDNLIEEKKYYETLYQNNIRNNFGSEFVNKGIMVVELASSYESKKVIYGLKFLENIKKVDLFNKRLYMDLIPDLKNKLFEKVHYEKYNKIEIDNKIREDKKKERVLGYKKKMVNELKGQLKDFQDMEDLLEDEKPELDYYSYNNKNLKKVNNLEKNKKKVNLRNRFKEFFENKSYLEYFNKDQEDVIVDNLQPLEDNKNFMSKKGREFNNKNIENTLNILKERSFNKNDENFDNLNYFLLQDLKNDFNEFSKEEVLKEFKNMSYEYGVKENEISKFEENLQVFNKKKVFNPLNDFKKITKRGGRKYNLLKRNFSEEIKILKWENKLYSEIFEEFKNKIKDEYDGKNFETEEFKNWTINLYKRKKKK